MSVLPPVSSRLRFRRRLSFRVPGTVHGERANQVTHGLGLVLSLAGTFEVYRRLMQGAELWQWVGCSIYLFTLVGLFAASTLSHSFEERQRRDFYRTLDQVAIFALCSGSLTPFALRYLSHGWWWLLVISWTGALFGSLLKIYVARTETMTLVTYMGVGWLPALATRPLMQQMPLAAQWLVAFGAVCYMLGLFFFINDLKHRYYHAIWHLLVVVGTACVYFAMLICVIPEA